MKNRKKYSPLAVVTVAASGLICLYYFVYLLLCIFGFDSRLMSLFALFVMACAALPIIFHKRLQKLLKRAFKPLWIIFTSLLCIYIATVIAFWCYIGLDAAKTPAIYGKTYAAEGNTGKDTVVMIYGCRTYGYTPSLTLRLRLDAAYELLTQLPDATCIVSGGQGSNETVPEAVAMREYLVDRGIAEERIITEAESHSTSENVRFTKALIEELGLTDKRIIGVSTAFHLPRIEMLTSRYGLPMELCSSPSPSFGHHYVSMIREYLSYIKMMLFDDAVIITKIT
ncbi:MAG: YdcF family protein [Clostridia bacterium]|nr:YdcF family protein [Clostridia bacterium]